MQVHTLRVYYTREKQPKDYEKAAPSIEFSAALDDGEDHVAAGLSLMRDACHVVYAALGFDIPEGVAAKLASGGMPAGGTVTADAKPAARGRKPNKKGAEEPQPNIRTSPEDRKDPADPSSDIPDEKTAGAASPAKAAAAAAASDIPDDKTTAAKPAEPAAKPSSGDFTAEELQSFITQMVSSKKVPVTKVKEILAAHGATRTSDVPKDKLLTVKEQIELASIA